jgi:surfactin synthase thioesterase subunit
LRADLALQDDYRAAPGVTVRAPITTVRGCEDDLVPAVAVAGWAACTTGGCDAIELPGRHMYLAEDPERLLATIADRLRAG